MAWVFDGPSKDDGFVQSELMPGSKVLKEHPDVTRAAQAIYGEKTPAVLAARPLSSPWAQERLTASPENCVPGITGGEALPGGCTFWRLQARRPDAYYRSPHPRF
jgi:hypothetical protein